MNQRTVLIMISALIVLSLLAVFGHRSGTDTSAVNALLLPDLTDKLNAVEQVTIQTAGAEAAVTLQRAATGWTVAQRDSYPADINMIRNALTELAEARIVEEKTANPELFDRLGVEAIDDADAGGLALVLSGQGVESPTVILGDSEGAEYRYARRADDNQSYMIDRDPEVPRDAAQWLVPEILDVRGPRIERVTISHTDGETLDIFKSEVNQPNFSVADIPEGRELQYPGVANVIGNSLRDLRLEDVAAVGDLSVESSVVTEFQTFDGLIVRVQSLRVGEHDWLIFDARVEEEPAPVGEPAPDEENGSDTPDPAAEATAINERVGGWRYRIASYQHDQMTRRLEDLLAAEAAEESDE